LRTRSDSEGTYLLLKLSLDNVTEDLEFTMSVGSKALVGLDAILVDYAKVSPFLIARIIIAAGICQYCIHEKGGNHSLSEIEGVERLEPSMICVASFLARSQLEGEF
jgi:hypothetical protein